MITRPDGRGRDRPEVGPALDLAVRLLALCGGVLLLAAGIMVTTSVVLRWTGSGGIPGDFEMMEMATALAVFAFLPLCQARRGNIMVDTFTGWLPERVRRTIDGLSDLLWAGLAALIAWQSLTGGREETAYGTTSMVSGIPVGPVVLATAALAAVLAVVATVTGIRMIMGRP